VTLGEHDEELYKVQVLEGLTVEDYIAFPDETMKE
jgi:HlyD family secretion protein